MSVKFTKEQIRELAIDVIQHFEDLLAEYNIKIPDNDREKENDDIEACIFGGTYYTLEDNVYETLYKALKNVKLESGVELK